MGMMNGSSSKAQGGHEVLSLEEIRQALKGSDALSSKVSPPMCDPGSIYPEVPGLNAGYQTFQLAMRPDGLTGEQYSEAMRKAHTYITSQRSRLLGFQTSQDLQFSQELAPYLDMHVNNVGDPFALSLYTVNSKFMERAVLDYFASLWNARWPNKREDGDSYWGSLTMGATEGNLYAMWNARDYLGGKMLLHEPTSCSTHHGSTSPGLPPVAFYSADTHYSLAKVMAIVQIQTFHQLGMARFRDECPLPGWAGKGWPLEVPSDRNGSINVDALETLAEFFISRGYPIVVCFNYGTTFKGAFDDVRAAGERLVRILKQHGMHERRVGAGTRRGFWFHVDGALGAAYMPLIEAAHSAGLIDQRGPDFDFRLPFVSSVLVSGHKWAGSPNPCGIFLTKTRFLLHPATDPAYIGAAGLDTTFSGSRNGLSALALWVYYARHSTAELTRKALTAVAVADYAELRLREVERELGQDLLVHHTPLALTVLFKRPVMQTISKFSLSNDYNQGHAVSHIFAMDHVTTDLLDQLILDLRTFGFQDQEAAPEGQERVECQPPVPPRTERIRKQPPGDVTILCPELQPACKSARLKA